MGPIGSVGAGTEYLDPTRIRSPGRPAGSESLYRVSYPGTYITLTKVLYDGICTVHVVRSLNC